MSEWGVFARYGIEEHRDVLEAFPELRVALVMAKTYDEASWTAYKSVSDRLKELGVTDEANWIHHPHRADSKDPVEWFGSWGARWTAAAPEASQ